MKILAIACRKGGSGKTTVAVNLAVAATQAGLGVAIVDLDDQATATDWWNAREAESPALLETSLRELPAKLAQLAAAGLDLVVIDTPPTANAAIREVIRLADFVLIPVQPSPNDIRALVQTLDIVNEEEKRFAFCITRSKSTSKTTSKTIAALSEFGQVAPVPISDRVAFADLMATGQTVLEVSKKSDGAHEVRELFEFVQTQLHKKKSSRKKYR